MYQMNQLEIFDEKFKNFDLNSQLWNGSFNGRESTIQQLSPYVGKMKSGMARVLIELYSKPNEIVFDPFSGSGVVPFEAALLDRVAWANDLSPYAFTLTKGKLDAPHSKNQAIRETLNLLEQVEKKALAIDTSNIPEWVREFFHPRTLNEIIAAFDILKHERNLFLTSCLLGILHHVRPGFLSYPASHLVPYLRKSKYPPEQFPQMYEYRDLRSRLLAKVERAYRRTLFPRCWENRKYKVWQMNVMELPIPDESIDAIISSPPYFGALDYARDNRLRLWFLGCHDWKQLDETLTAKSNIYLSQMAVCLKELTRILRSGGACALVLGDVQRDGKTKKTAEILADLAAEESNRILVKEAIFDDQIPDERRSRRGTKTTKFERILVLRKRK